MNKKAPKEIWLQGADDIVSGETTWCIHKIGGDDVKYIRADLVETPSKANSHIRAASPELYEALQLILPLAKGYRAQPKSDSARRTNDAWIAAAEAALAKAAASV